MLLDLYVENFVLIDKAHIPFEPGLNIFTGETGAGKSILLNALSLLLGVKANKQLIMKDSDNALVKGTFHIPSNFSKRLKEEFAPDEDVLIIKREIKKSGKSIASINGHIVTIKTLKEVSLLLFDIHGQNQHTELLDDRLHLHYIDKFGREAVCSLLEEISLNVKAQGLLVAEIKDLEERESERLRELDLLTFQRDEIESANLEAADDEQLEHDYEMAKNSSQIDEVLKHGHSLINEGNMTYSLSELSGSFKKYIELDETLSEIYKKLNDAYYILEDVSRDIDRGMEQFSVDQATFFKLEQRIDLVNTLKRKYGNSVEEIETFYQTVINDIDTLNNLEEILDQKRQALSSLHVEYQDKADRLTTVRRELATSFSEQIIAILERLNFNQAKFDVNIERRESPHTLGQDLVSFLVSTNPGQPLTSLSETVSGGELSRIMLAIKVLLGERDEVATQIFDEIDAGISGHTAKVIGRELRNLAKNRQILCITHLPQIAVCADHHIFIEKSVVDGNTYTQIKPIDDQAIIAEIHRLTNGGEMTTSSRASVIEMIGAAKV